MMPEDKEDLYNTVFTELKRLGVKVPKVKKFKSLVSKQEKALAQSKNKIFGVHLCDQEWIADRDFIVPKFIASSIGFLRDFITVEGIFRKAGSIARQRDLRVKLEEGGNLDGSEPNDVASLLKQWLRELPEPLIPNYMHDLYIRCYQLENKECRINANLLACLLLPPDHLRTLKYLLNFLSDLADQSKKNMMKHRNLALIIAPNIFFMSAESADKSSPELAELHTNIFKLLIKNAKKVGAMPASFQHCVLESCPELDSSGDLLDSSPCNKTRKKRRSGPVQDIFNGIKKLVGQNVTPAPKSASKRKAENYDGSLPKKLTVEMNGEHASCETPKNQRSKLPNTDGKVGRTRKKSFGLLRRKRQKSAQSPQPKEGLKSPFSWDVEVEVKMDKVNNTLQLPDLPSPVSPFNLFGTDKCDSIKKSTSDCYLVVPSAKVSALYSSSSQGQLPNISQVTPYNLRTKIEGSRKNQMESLESIQLEMKKIMDDSEGENNYLPQANSGSPAFQKSPPNATKLSLDLHKKERVVDVQSSIKSVEPKSQDVTAEVKVIGSENKSFRRSSSRKKGSGNPSLVYDNLLSSNENSKKVGAKSLLSETLLQLDSRLPNKEISMATHKRGSIKQEASNLKLQKKQVDPTKSYEANNMKKKSHENRSSKKDNLLRKSQSINLGSKNYHGNNISIKRIAEKTTRKASIIRGRPNTVKSGLPSDLCQRFNNDSFLVSNSDLVDNTLVLGSNVAKNKDISLLNCEDIFLKNENISSRSNKEASFIENVSPLNLKFESFTLTSPPIAGINDEVKDSEVTQNTTFTIFDDSSSTKEHKSHLEVNSQNQKLSLPNLEEKSPFTKTPRLRKSLDTTGRKISISKVSSSLKRKSSSNLCDKKSAKLSLENVSSFKDLSTLDISMNDSCFKTPNKIASPDSVIWMSGKKFLDANFPQSDEKFNKRESIAMILKNKPGHVQNKVNLWDTKVRESVYCTRSVPGFSTPTAAFVSNEISQKQRSHSQKKPLSVSKSCNSGNGISRSHRAKPPLPPPPKFVESESTPSPSLNRPLKEVTNLNLGMNESKNSINGSKDECGFLDVSLENLVPRNNRKKLNRNSFNDTTPQKFAKKVSRSESSPCRRPVRRSSRTARQSTIDLQSTELDENFIVPAKRLLRSSISKSGSCLSIEKLRSDQTTGEWQCEM
ncbi:hypothetical protein JTE90_009378 [Oedothorax gibbosus]|uniref:Rho-GAP domain-containing protein n=1 Tax=Oedothorax gibbosus TaxID=931172 RepID=A0AAV6VS77_9ARAC|nr:hypothetical protein JTE90_009378 [Oedothorax gibbosus]